MAQTPTIESVAISLARLYREVRQLKREVQALTETIGDFKTKYPIPKPPELHLSHPVDTGGQTSEPRSAFSSFLYELTNEDDLGIPTRALLAVGKDLDGALRDIRAARADIAAIADDSDLRSEFTEWQKNR